MDARVTDIVLDANVITNTSLKSSDTFDADHTQQAVASTHKSHLQQLSNVHMQPWSPCIQQSVCHAVRWVSGLL